MTENRTEKKKRQPGLKANYQGASPKQVTRAFYWNRRTKLVVNSNQEKRNRSSSSVLKASL